MRVQLAAFLALAMFLAGPLMAASPSGQLGRGGPAGPSADGAVFLYLKAGTFDPLTEPAPGPSSLHERSTAPYYVVQFDGPIQRAWREAFSGAGGELLSYLPDFAYFARVPAASLGRVMALDHLRYIGPAHLAYRVDPSLWYSTGLLDLELVTFASDGASRLAGAVLGAGGGVYYSSGLDRVTVRMTPRGAIALLEDASLGVEWLGPKYWPEPTLDNDARSSNARQNIDGPYQSNGQAMWSYNAATDSFEGSTGKNVTVAVDDSGLDDSHPAFAGRIVHYYDYGGDGQSDTNGHGTHVAGIVLGDGSWRSGDVGSDGKYVGIAPEAGLVVQEIFNNVYGPSVYNRDATRSGATISSNSWGFGTWGAYYSTCQEYDDATRDADPWRTGEQPLLFTYSAGNDGDYGMGTVTAPGTAKNVITVGATGNDKAWTSSDTVVSFSSRGPTQDGRLKPDVVMPGAYVASARSLDGSACYGWERPADGARSYVFGSGTSMSSPGVAGAAAVATQYMVEKEGIAAPSPALLKASLINGARPLAGYDYPGNVQGWGTVDLVDTLVQTDTHRIYRDDQSIDLDTASGESSQSYWFMVYDDEPLKVTLVWTDVGGTGAGSKDLVNDLDLELRGPDGQTYLGNAFSGGESQPETSMSTRDRTNNVEGFLVRSPKQGIWTITVKAYNVPSGPQDFALVLSGHAQKGHVDVTPVSLVADPQTTEEHHQVHISARVGNTGNRASGVLWYRLEHTAPDGTVTVLESANLTDLAPGATADLGWTFTGARGTHTLRLVLDPDGIIPESNETNNALALSYFFIGYEPLVSAQFAELHPDPGQIVDFNITVRNGGNVVDDLSVTLTDAPAGWHATLLADTFKLGAGEALPVVVTIMPPSDAVAGDRAELVLSVSSLGNASKVSIVTLVAVVNQIFAMDMTASVDHLDLFPGDNGTFTVVLGNPGNGLDTYDLAMPDELPAGWWVTLPQLQVGVPFRSQGTVSVVLNAPDPSPAGSTAWFDLHARSAQSGMERSVRLTATILQFYDNRLTATHRDVDADVGTSITVPLIIDNMGNGPVEYLFDISAPSSDWFAGCTPGSITVPGYGSGPAELTFRVPDRAINATYDLSLGVIPSGGPVMHHNFTFAARQFHSLELKSVSQPPVVTQGQSATVTMRIVNLGNGIERVKLLASDLPVLWAYDGASAAYEVAPFGQLDVQVVLETSKDTPGGTYRVGMLARYSFEGSANATAEVRVLTRPDLEIVSGSLNASELTPTVGAMVQVGLAVTNVGQTAAYDIYLQLYVDGIPVGQPQFLTSLAPGEAEPFTFLWQTNMSGLHIVSAVVDFTHVVDETREDNNGAQITVQVEQIHYKTTPALPYPWVLLALASMAALALGARRMLPRGRAGK